MRCQVILQVPCKSIWSIVSGNESGKRGSKTSLEHQRTHRYESGDSFAVTSLVIDK